MKHNLAIKAKWISVNAPEYRHGAIHFGKGSFLLRKNFNLPKPFKKAVMTAAGLGYGVYTINGKKVTSDVLTTPFTKFDSRVLYNAYDVGDLIAAGENVIGAYMGNGWYNNDAKGWNYDTASWRGMPKLLLSLDIEFADGSAETIVTDSSWKWRGGPCVYNNMREGEMYDARLEQDGWDTAGFSADGWENAFVCRSPGGILEPSEIPPIRVIRTLPGNYTENGIYDFGENISGWARIKAEGEAGREISLYYSERLDAGGRLDTENINKYTFGEQKHCDKYIMRGGKIEEWAPGFIYHGFRYIQAENAPETFEIRAEVVHTDLETVGTFECSDPMLNKIHEASCRSTLTNFHSIPTDCPHREQNGWTGDALLSAEQALMNFNMYPAYRKWLNDFKDVQRPDGQLPGIVPTSNWGYTGGNGPAWDSALIQIPWLVYLNTGDKSLIEQMWENMNRYMGYFGMMSEGFLADFGLGDWCPPKNAVKCPTIVTDTAFYYADSVVMSRAAGILGETGKSGEYATLAANIRAAYRTAFLDDIELEKSQTFLACGIYNGLYNDDEIAGKAEKLNNLVANNGYRIDCGILGTKFIFNALSDNGYCETAYKMVVNPEMPSYAHWINSGMTTLCEDWEMENSLNHHMFSEVDNWFYRHLAGIQITPEMITIKPCFIPLIERVKASHRDISVEYGGGKLTVNVPRPAIVRLNGEVHEVDKGTWEFSY